MTPTLRTVNTCRKYPHKRRICTEDALHIWFEKLVHNLIKYPLKNYPSTRYTLLLKLFWVQKSPFYTRVITVNPVPKVIAPKLVLYVLGTTLTTGCLFSGYPHISGKDEWAGNKKRVVLGQSQENLVQVRPLAVLVTTE